MRLCRFSAQEVEHTIKEALASLLRLYVRAAEGAAQFHKQAFLLVGQLGRDDNLQDNQLIATAARSAIRTDARRALALEPEDFAGLRPCRYVQALFAVDSRNRDLRAKRCLRDVDFHVEQNV